MTESGKMRARQNSACDAPNNAKTHHSQDTVQGPVEGLLDVAVVEDDVRALTTELETRLLQVRLRGGLEDLATDERAAGERDLGQ